MCAPLALAAGTLAINVAGKVLQHKAEQKQVEAQQQANARTLQLTTDSANRDATLQNQTLDLRLAQETDAANATIFQNDRTTKQSIIAADRQARMADATARVGAGAAGVEGASVDALLGDIARQDASTHFVLNQDNALATKRINQNLSMLQEQVGLSRQGIEAERMNRINSVTNLPTAPAPSLVGTGLQIGGSVVDFLNTLQQRKP
jgi:hypothetical protein